MYNASSKLAYAIKYFVPKNTRNTRKKIKVGKRHCFYYADRDYYWNFYLKSAHWKELRNKKMLANPICENCHSNKCLDVHHIDYKNLYDVELNDLKVLCRECHKKEHIKLKQINNNRILKKQRRREKRIQRNNFRIS